MVLTWGTYVCISNSYKMAKRVLHAAFSHSFFICRNFCFNLINWIKNENEIFSLMPHAFRASFKLFFRFHRETQSRSTPNVQIMKLKFFIVWSTSDKITSFHFSRYTPHIAEWWIKHIMKIKVDLRSKRWWWGNARNISN